MSGPYLYRVIFETAVCPYLPKKGCEQWVFCSDSGDSIDRFNGTDIVLDSQYYSGSNCHVILSEEQESGILKAVDRHLFVRRPNKSERRVHFLTFQLKLLPDI